MRERTQSLHIGQSVRSFVRRPPLNGAQSEHGFVSNKFHVHLVSDATGETLNSIAKAALAQFEDVHVEEHSYVLVRSRKQLDRAIDQISAQKGLVFFTMVNPELRTELISRCAAANLPCL